MMYNSSIKLGEGDFTFSSIVEDDIIVFTPPLKVTWDVWNETVGKIPGIWAYAHLDFGMTTKFSVERARNFLMKGYDNLNENSTYAEIIEKTLKFDLFHALTHPNQDPNYGYVHWALSGWLKDRFSVIELNHED